MKGRTKSSALCIGWLCWLLGAAFPASAQEAPDGQPQPYVQPDYLRKLPTIPPHWHRPPAQRLSLREAIEIALRRNLDVALQSEVVVQVDTNRRSALGNFEPLVWLNGGRTTSQTAPVTSLDGRAGQLFKSTIDSWNLNLIQTLPTATSLTLSFSNGRTSTTRGSAVAPLLYNSALQLQISQPLLQGFSLNNRVQLQSVLVAEFATASAREQARQQAITTVKATEDLYWSLVTAWKTYEVKRSAYEAKQRQLKLTRRRFAAGIAAEGDIITVQSDLAGKEVEMLATEAGIETAADALRQQLNLPAEDWEQPVLPVDAPNFTPLALPFGAAWERALVSRPELKLWAIDHQKDDLNLAVARNKLLPQLTVNSSLMLLGQDQDYGQTLTELGSRSGWQWTAGADLRWNPLEVQARAGVRGAQSALRQDELRRQQLLNQIRVDLRGALRNIETAQRRVYAAARSRDLAERSLDVEQRKLESGLSTNIQVAVQQGALETARLAELQALIDHERARSDFLRVTGELLEARQLKFAVRAAD